MITVELGLSLKMFDFDKLCCFQETPEYFIWAILIVNGLLYELFPFGLHVFA